MAAPMVELHPLTDGNRAAVLALELAPGQDRFVSSVPDSLAEAEAFPHANPWYRAVVVDGEEVGFVMLSWNCVPVPGEIIGPWFLWKLLVDRRHQGRGIGRATVAHVADLVREAGATELLTSCVDEPDGPRPFYERLGFRPTGDRDDAGEVILSLPLDGPIVR